MKKINALNMLRGGQAPRFYEFDGKEKTKYHIAHVIETCNNVGIEGALLWSDLV